jgi:hypothetical protein
MRRTGFLATVYWSCLEDKGGVPEKTALVCNPTGSYGFSRKKTLLFPLSL